MRRPAALGPGRELVAQADVGQRPAHHHLVIAAARAVGVEVARRDPVRYQVLTGRALHGNRPRRGDVVGGDRIAQQGQDAHAGQVLHEGLGIGHLVEVGRPLDIGRGLAPLEQAAVRHRHRFPPPIALEHLRILLAEHLGVDRAGQQVADLLGRRPDLAEVHRPPAAIRPQRLLLQVDIDRTGQRVGDHQRRRGQVVGLHLLVDAAFEVAVAAEYRRHHQFLALDRFRDGLGQRAAVSDAGRAAEPDQVESQLLEVRDQARLLQIVHHHLRARRQAGLHPGLALKSALDGLLGQQAGPQHHGGVRGVGATCDGRDHHRAVGESPPVLAGRGAEEGGEVALHVGQAYAVLRALGAG